VTDYITRYSLDDALFIPKLFQGFPEIKEALLGDALQIGFMVAPMAIALRSQGAPMKIVYLGHRYGSSCVVRKHHAGGIAALRGKTIAIPSRFSDERLLTRVALAKHGVAEDEVKMVEMPPPEMASALEVGAIDAFTVGEPYPAQSEMSGIGKILFWARDFWPDYMSCVVVARQDVIDERPQAVQVLIDGLARSGVWLDEKVEHRKRAAQFVGRKYFKKPPQVLEWSLTNPPERVEYQHLTPRQADFEMVRDMMYDLNLIDVKLPFHDFVEPRFAEAAEHLTAWKLDDDGEG
jgi:NitT/TauT family transport system substrate-binding protein